MAELKRRVLAVDIDGTLVNSKKEITPGVLGALRVFQEAGGILVLASGRPPHGMMRYAEELELKKYGGYVLAFNGSRVLDTRSGQLVFQKNLDYRKVPQIAALGREYGVAVLTYEGNTIITETPDNRFLQLEKEINGLELKVVESIGDYVRFEIPKCLGTAEPELLLPLERALREQIDNVSVFRSEPFFLEVNPIGIGKGEVLRMLVETRLGLTARDVVACGDGYNDITMLGYAGVGAAMANARDAVLNCADVITHSNQEDGVARMVYEYCFG